MDYITHIVTGATGYRIIRTQSLPWTNGWKEQALTICGSFFFLASVLPDFDNISRLWGMEAYIIHHRGMTHSILFMVIIASIFGFLFGRFLKWAPAPGIFFSVLIGTTFHLYMDLITSYGTQLFWPFTNARLRLDWVFIVDPIYTIGIIFVLLGSALFIKKPKFDFSFQLSYNEQSPSQLSQKVILLRKMFVVAFILWIIVYPLFCATAKALTSAWINNSEKLHSKWYLMPDLGTPFVWKLITLEDNTYKVASVNIVDRKITFSDQTFTPLDGNLAKKAFEKLSSFRTYQWFAVYPYQRFWGKDKIVEIGDLRFFSPLQIVQNRRPIPPFTVFIHLSNSGSPEMLTYGSP